MRTTLAGSNNTSPNKKVTQKLAKKTLKERMQHYPFWTGKLTKKLKIHIRIEHKEILSMSALFFFQKKEDIMEVIIVFITKPCDLTTENKVLLNKELRYF